MSAKFIGKPDAALSGPMTIDEFRTRVAALRKQQEAEWNARKGTKLGDVVIPELDGTTFRHAFDWREREVEDAVLHQTRMVPYLRVFPQFEKPRSDGDPDEAAPFAHAANSLNWLIDAFGRRVYSTLLIHQHVRTFDPGAPNEKGVKNELKTNPDGSTRWVRYGLVGGDWKPSTPPRQGERGSDGKFFASWISKHRLIDEALMAIADRRPFDVWFFFELSLEKAKRVLDDRLENTLEEIAQLRSEDWTMSKLLHSVANDPAPASTQVPIGTTTAAPSVVKLASPHAGERDMRYPLDPSNEQSVTRLQQLIARGYRVIE